MTGSSNNHNTNLFGRESVCAAIQNRLSLHATLGPKTRPFAHIMVNNGAGASSKVQVHATNYTNWQFTSVEPYLKIAMDERGQKQMIVGLTDLEYPDTPVTLVSLGAKHNRPDRFFVFTRRVLQKLIEQQHSRWLAKHDGTRPRNPSSTHCAIRLRDIEQYEDNWGIIRDALK